MGATIRDSDRIGSVKNTKKITRSCRLQSPSCSGRVALTPFLRDAGILGGLLVRLQTEALDIPLLETREAKKVGTFLPKARMRTLLLSNKGST